MEIIYGNTLADRIKADMKQKIDDIRAEGARLPLLSVVLVGNDPASMSYVRGKEKACSSIGMLQRTIRLDENVSQKELNDVERKINLKKAFQLVPNIVKYRKILIVDDIYTTGSTIDAVAEVLLQAGVDEIYFLCISIGEGF